jgi:hypothetical protein
MISKEQIEVNICRAYIQYVKDGFPSGACYADRYLFILRIREWQLKLKLRNVPLKLEHFSTLKQGIREAGRFLDEVSESEPRLIVQEISDILRRLILGPGQSILAVHSRCPSGTHTV